MSAVRTRFLITPLKVGTLTIAVVAADRRPADVASGAFHVTGEIAVTAAPARGALAASDQTAAQASVR
jgi:hypothetical protein